MNIKTLGWHHKSPEYKTGDYWFNGQFFITKQVIEALSALELLAIREHISVLVKRHQGIDYIQTFYHPKKRYSLFLIDQITRESLLSGEQPQEHNYCTLMFKDEY